MARKRYCASYHDHWWVCKESRVSEGLKDVARRVIEDEAGDCLDRIIDLVDLNLRRRRYGMVSGHDSSLSVGLLKL